MHVITITWWTGIAVLGLAAGLVLPGLAALVGGEWVTLSAIALSAIICTAIGGGALLISQNRTSYGHVKAGIHEVITFLMVWWAGVPLVAGLPFVFTGMNLADGWFESVSALTTTGAWLSLEGMRSSFPLMLWRAELQWLGGLVSIASAAAVFFRPQFIGIDVVNTPFARGEDESFLRGFRKAVAGFLPAYCVISLVIFIMFAATGTPAGDAFVMALSLTASGGMVPDAGGFAAYGTLAIAAAFMAMVLSGVSFVSTAKLLAPRERAFRFRDDRETPLFVILVAITGVILVLSIPGGGLDDYGHALLNAVSLLSTNGVVSGAHPALTPALVTAIIGGASISAAGGIKLIRWLVTFERAGEEIWKLIHPRGVIGRARAVNELGVWVHFVAFTIILSSLVLVITIYGTPLELSVTTAVAVISNAGPMIALAPGDVVDYQIFDPRLRVMLALGMIAGRVEMVVALAVLSRDFWRA